MSSTPWIVEWIDEFSLHKDIDEEHQQFIEHIDLLNSALADQARDKLRTKVILEQLIQETEEHFDHEERIFASLSIENVAEHRDRHAEIVSTVKAAMQQFDSTELPKVWTEIAMSIKSVLIQHFLECDFAEIEKVRH